MLHYFVVTDGKATYMRTDYHSCEISLQYSSLRFLLTRTFFKAETLDLCFKVAL